MSTVWQAAKCEHPVLTQSVNELTGDTENFSSLSGGELVFGAEHHDVDAVSYVVEDFPHGDLDGVVASQTAG